MNKFIVSTASSSIANPVIGYIVIPALRVLQKRTNRGTVLTGDSQSVTVSLHEEYIRLVQRPVKSQRRALYGGAKQLSVGLAPTTLRNAKPVRGNRFIAFSSIDNVFFKYMQRDISSVKCTAKAPFEDVILVDWMRNGRRPTEFCVSRIVNWQLFISTFIQAAMILTCNHAYVFHSKTNF